MNAPQINLSFLESNSFKTSNSENKPLSITLNESAQLKIAGLNKEVKEKKEYNEYVINEDFDDILNQSDDYNLHHGDWISRTWRRRKFVAKNKHDSSLRHCYLKY